MRSYDAAYLEDAMFNMGSMVDYAVSDCGMDMGEYLSLFCLCGIADLIASGHPKYLAGKSGAEIAVDVFLKTGFTDDMPKPGDRFKQGKFFWCGWILAFAQWKTGFSFERILKAVPAGELERLYGVLHEAPEEKFVEVLLEREAVELPERRITRLQMYRKRLGLTQKQLSVDSGVSLRSIQMYEQRNKDINRAQTDSVVRLADALKCDVKDLLESEEAVSENIQVRGITDDTRKGCHHIRWPGDAVLSPCWGWDKTNI